MIKKDDKILFLYGFIAGVSFVAGRRIGSVRAVNKFVKEISKRTIIFDRAHKVIAFSFK